VSGSGSDSDFVFGAYVALNAGWQFNDRWSVVGSAQYQYLSNYQHSFGGRSVEADLKGIFITLGIAYKF
jgi:outer membrane scaffolding protein for murein synthesis (MipA/OmpV family)